MLSYDSLLQQAVLRGMPLTKTRGILREYLQILALKEISRLELGRKLYLTGGTYLRLVYNLKRFSEDLDFNTDALSKRDFARLCQEVSRGLARSGIASKVATTTVGSVYSGDLIFPTIERDYRIVSPHSKKGGIIIKLQTNTPKWVIKKETEILSGFGETFPCVTTHRGALFADKIDAIAKKQRGRHIYDIVFMLMNRFPIDADVLKTLGIREEPAQALTKAVLRFSIADLKKQAESLTPFLFDENEAQWLTRSQEMIPALLAKYQV